MTQFPISPGVKRYIGLALAQRFPTWTFADLAATNSVLTINRPLTADQVALVQAAIDAATAEAAAVDANRRTATSSYAWMQGRAAKQWKRAIDPKRRAAQ
jgi:hypothetical protein